MAYCCERCGYKTEYKHSLQLHLKRKNTCQPSISDIDVNELLDKLLHKEYNEVTYDCEFCDKRFNNMSSRSRHYKCCKKRNELGELKNMINDLTESNKKLHEELVKIKDQPVNITNNNTMNIQQNNLTINMRSFGFENIAHLEKNKDFMTQCLINKDVMGLIENIHCDSDHPENQNVRIKSQKKELMETYVDGRWIVSDQEETLDELLNKGYRILNFFSYRNKEHIVNECEAGIDEYHEMREWLEELYSNSKMRKPLKRKLLILFMNNKTLFLEKGCDDD